MATWYIAGQINKMNDVQLAQQKIIDEFAFFDTWIDRYQYLIDLGRRLQPLDESELSEANRIRGCQSQVWMVAESDGDILHFRAISDAAIVSGLIAILLRIYSGKKPADIASTPPDFVSALQLEAHLSPTRSNGLAAMLKAIHQHAADALQAT